MGKLLQTLNPLNGHVAPASEKKPPPDAAPAPPVPPPAEEACEEFPYIEVGAPGKKIEASPTVLAAPASARSAKPCPKAKTSSRDEPPAAAEPPAASNLAATLRHPAPLGVTLQAWPPARRGGAIAREIVAYHQPDHPISKQYGELFARMIEDLAPASPALLLALGVKPQVGTTTVLLNVAVSGAAAQTHRLIVVDANWARPALTQRLGLGAPPGLADFFAGSLALEQAAVPVLPQLHVLAPGAKPLTEKALASPAMSWIVSWLRERYDVILVDGPDLAEARHIAPLVTAADGAYLILPQGAAPPNQTLLTPLAGKVRGLIHTHFEPL